MLLVTLAAASSYVDPEPPVGIGARDATPRVEQESAAPAARIKWVAWHEFRNDVLSVVATVVVATSPMAALAAPQVLMPTGQAATV